MDKVKVKVEEINLHLNSITKGDERSVRLLWIVGPFVIAILLIVACVYMWKNIETFGFAELSVLVSLIGVVCGMVVFILIINDRLHNCIKRASTVRMYVIIKNSDKVASMLENLCADKLSIKELKELIPSNPFGKNGHD